LKDDKNEASDVSSRDTTANGNQRSSAPEQGETSTGELSESQPEDSQDDASLAKKHAPACETLASDVGRQSENNWTPVGSCSDESASQMFDSLLLQQEQESDEVLKLMLEYIQTGEKPAWAEISHLGLHLKQYWSQWSTLKYQHGILYRQTPNRVGDETLQALIPQSLRTRVMYHMHDHSTAGHLGMKKTYEKIKERFYWVSCKDDVEKYCKNCDVCQKRSKVQPEARAPLKSNNVGLPLEKVGLDILGPLPMSYAGHKYVLGITDYFTKWVELYPMKDQTAQTIATIFVNEFISRYGLVRQIITDQGRQFESSLFQEICRILDIDKVRTSAFRPSSNGQIERINRTILDMLSKYVSVNQRDWDQYLPLLLLAYRSSVHESTNFTPHMMMFGRNALLPIDLLFGHQYEGEESCSQDSFVEKIQQRLRIAYDGARQHMLVASKRQKKGYDHRIRVFHYLVGDRVWLKSMKRTKGRSPKLQPRWEGPFIITKLISSLVIQISTGRNKLKNVHHNRLKPYVQC